MGAPLTGQTARPERAVIIGGGEVRDYAAVSARLRPDDFIICADSGYDHCGRLGIAPHLLLGDFDSIRGTPPESIPRLPFPAEKNYTDTTLAIETALERGHRELLLTGMLGGRLDHTLANLQSLAGLSVRGVGATLTDGHTDAFAVTDGEVTFGPKRAGPCYFSLLCYSQECRGVTIRGARYLLHDHTLRFDVPRAVSNEFLDGPCTVVVGKGTLVVLIVPKAG